MTSRGSKVLAVAPERELAGAILVGAGRVVAARPELPPTPDLSPSLQRMLLVALRLFAERGFHGTSVRDIAGDLEIKPASLYSLVESKEHLLALIVELGHSVHYWSIEEAVRLAGEDPVDQMAAFMGAHVRFHAHWQMLAVVTNTELHCLPPALAAPSLVLREQAAQTLLRIIERGVERGVFRVNETFLATTAIAAMGMRVATWFDPKLGHSEDDVAQEYTLLSLRVVGADTHTMER